MNKKKKLFVMCGPAGSGKSSWIASHRHVFNRTETVVSRDVIRFSMLTNKDAYFSREKEVYKEFIREIKEALESSEVVFADATHLTQGSRTKLLRALGPALKDVEVNAIALKVPMELAIKQNNQRDGLQRVPEGVIESMYGDYTTPTIEEGFDVVWQAIYQPKNNTFTYVADVKDINEYYAESEV